MNSTFKIGRIAGIDIGVHWSWLLIFVLITFSFASSDGILREFYEDWSLLQLWTVSAGISVIFFGCILLHELSHSLVARARGIPVSGITLFVLGGVSTLTREAKSAGEEFQVAIVGPLTSLLIGAIFALIWVIFRGPFPNAAAISAYLAFINGSLAVFNLLPGFPLDGGRVLRSIVWALNHDLLRATNIAARTGEGVAYLLMGVGAVQVFVFQNPLGGVWMFLIGMFLRSASSASYEQMVTQSALAGVSALEVARKDFIAVSPDEHVSAVVTEHMLAGHGRCYPVTAGQELLGLFTLTDAQRLAREVWETTTVYRAMTPFERLHTVGPDDDAIYVLQIMGEADVNQVPVVDRRLILGLVTRGDVLRVIQTRKMLAGRR